MMNDATRTQVARLLRSYRRHIQTYTQKAAGHHGITAELDRTMAIRYREALAGALDMLDTIRGR